MVVSKLSEMLVAVKDLPRRRLIAAFANDSGGLPYLEVARKAAANYVPGMGELCAFGSEAGAIVVLDGKFPGQTEEKFFWMVLLPAGTNGHGATCGFRGGQTVC